MKTLYKILLLNIALFSSFGFANACVGPEVLILPILIIFIPILYITFLIFILLKSKKFRESIDWKKFKNIYLIINIFMIIVLGVIIFSSGSNINLFFGSSLLYMSGVILYNFYLKIILNTLEKRSEIESKQYKLFILIIFIFITAFSIMTSGLLAIPIFIYCLFSNVNLYTKILERKYKS